MCVIAVKPANITISKKTIEAMARENPDGMGIAIVEPHQTVISKGYFNVKDFWDDVNQMQDLLLVLHFRWATHGDIVQSLTHPFVIDKDPLLASSTYLETEDPVLFHNGVITGFGDKERSDTLHFANDVLAHLPSVAAMTKTLSLVSSKFIVVSKGKVHKVGEFYKHKGLIVSNTYFDKEPCSTIGFKSNYKSNFKYTGNSKGVWDYDRDFLLEGEVGDSGDDREEHDSFLSWQADSDKE